MWNYTVMAVMVVDSAEFQHVKEESYAAKPQKDITEITADDLDIDSKFLLTFQNIFFHNPLFLS